MPRGAHRRSRPGPRGAALRRPRAGLAERARPHRAGGPRHAGGGAERRCRRLLRVGRARQRPAEDLRALPDLCPPACARQRRGVPAALWPVAGSSGRRQLRQRGVLMATPESEWKLPRLRIDVNGDWLDDGVEVTHPGVLANLRANLRRDPQGYFIQTRVRIPGLDEVALRVSPEGRAQASIDRAEPADAPPDDAAAFCQSLARATDPRAARG